MSLHGETMVNLDLIANRRPYADEYVIAAVRAIYNRTIADRLIDHKDSPAHRVVKPRRLPNIRRALTAWELEPTRTTHLPAHPPAWHT